MLDSCKMVQKQSVAFFTSLKQNFNAYHSSNVSLRPDCIFEIDQLWQSGFSRVYSNCCCSCSFEVEIIKIGQSSYKMYNNNILNFQASTTILNACTKKSGNLLSHHVTFLKALIGLHTVKWFHVLLCNTNNLIVCLHKVKLIGYYGTPTLVVRLMPYPLHTYIGNVNDL